MPSSNPYLNAIQWGDWVWTDPNPATSATEITYYFDPGKTSLSGHIAGGGKSIAWLAYEKQAYAAAAQEWARVADITFTEVSTYAAADLVELLYSREFSTTLGMHDTPEHAADGDGTAWGLYNRGHGSWSDTSLLRGGYGFATLVHELGHALGLAHPHDDGGGSGVFPGVTPGDDADFGDNDLNQGIFTVMSYNGGWTSELSNQTPYQWGWECGPMAFDIAAIQDKYGANATYNATSTTYVLPDGFGSGVLWQCIWDTGGSDWIAYNGAVAATIDLTAATLDNSPTGGGVPSHATDVYGGYTIANGVVIENAMGGSGADTLTGNAAANALDGKGGADVMKGLAGSDTYRVDNVGDIVNETGGDGTDTVRSTIDFSLGNAAQVLGSVEQLTLEGAAIFATGNGLRNLLMGNAVNNALDGKGDADVMKGMAGADTYRVDNVGDLVDETLGDGAIDTVRTTVSFNLDNAAQALGQVEGIILDGSAAINALGNGLGNILTGNAAANSMEGKAGADILKGLGGADRMYGGVDSVRDTFVFAAMTDSGGRTGPSSAWDQVLQFNHSAGAGAATSDIIDLRLIDADLTQGGDQAFRFVADFASAGVGETKGQVRVVDAGANVTVEVDQNGDNLADMVFFVTAIDTLTAVDFLL